MAMEARCYRGGEGRTKMKPLQYSQKDYEAYMVFALYFVLIMLPGFICKCILYTIKDKKQYKQ